MSAEEKLVGSAISRLKELFGLHGSQRVQNPAREAVSPVILVRYPSLPFFHKIEDVKLAALASGVVLLFTKYSFCGLVFLAVSLLIAVPQWLWFRKGWKLTRSLGLKEYLLLESGLEIKGLPPGRVFENHLQVDWLRALKLLLKKPVFKERTTEMRQSYFEDYRKIAERCRSGEFGNRVYIVGTTHPTMMKWWVAAFESAGFKPLHIGYSIDPGAELGKLGWWLAQIAATGHVRSKVPPKDWKTCIAVWEHEAGSGRGETGGFCPTS